LGSHCKWGSSQVWVQEEEKWRSCDQKVTAEDWRSGGGMEVVGGGIPPLAVGEWSVEETI